MTGPAPAGARLANPQRSLHHVCMNCLPRHFAAAAFCAMLLAPAAPVAGQENPAGAADTAPMSQVPAAQAFGITMGQAADTLPIIETSETMAHVHYLAASPDYPEIERLSVLAPPATGVCSVVMTTKSAANDRRGKAAREQYDRLKADLVRQFGQPEETDALRRGSKWNDKDEFALSIWHGDRQLSSNWALGGQGGYSSIAVRVVTDRPNSLALLVNYKFANFSQCS